MEGGMDGGNTWGFQMTWVPPPPLKHGNKNLTCFKGGRIQALPACAWKPMLGCLETHAIFTTCHSNNVRAL